MVIEEGEQAQVSIAATVVYWNISINTRRKPYKDLIDRKLFLRVDIMLRKSACGCLFDLNIRKEITFWGFVMEFWQMKALDDSVYRRLSVSLSHLMQ